MQFLAPRAEHVPEGARVAAQADGVVSEVKSVACFRSPPGLDPSECNNANYFTAATLTTPVNVTAGQQVLVKVEISFA